MPRSGGEYIYVTRTLSPPIGLMCSWIVNLTQTAAVGLVCMWVVSYAIGDSFAAYALAGHPWANHVADFCWSNWGKTIGVVILCAIMMYVLLRGTKFVMRLIWINILVSFVILALLAVLVMKSGHSGFVQSWNAMNPQSYGGILKNAAGHGYLVPFALGASLMGGMTYVCQNANGSTFTANIAGEIQGVQKSQLIALVGSPLLLIVLWFALSKVVYAGIGAQFNSALSNLQVNGSSAYPASFHGREPFIGLLLVYFTKNPIILIGFGILVGLALWTSLIPLCFTVHRNMFAWSFDRILPAKFAELGKRYRQPWVTVLVVQVICLAFGLIYIWRPTWLGYQSFVILMWYVGWAFLGISGIIFPWRRKAIYLNAPPVVRAEFLGVPVISILGVITVVICIVTEVFILKPIVAGTISVPAVITAVALLVAPLVLFYVVKAYRAKSAVPLDMQFSQIPPE
jgi:amino acid transporter